MQQIRSDGSYRSKCTARDNTVGRNLDFQLYLATQTPLCQHLLSLCECLSVCHWTAVVIIYSVYILDELFLLWYLHTKACDKESVCRVHADIEHAGIWCHLLLCCFKGQYVRRTLMANTHMQAELRNSRKTVNTCWSKTLKSLFKSDPGCDQTSSCVHAYRRGF